MRSPNQVEGPLMKRFVLPLLTVMSFLVILSTGSMASVGGVFESTDGGANRNAVNTGNMITARVEHTATLLLDGRVLIVGGRDEAGRSLASTELYDPSIGTFTASGSMITARRLHTATLLADGTVLIAGGNGTEDILASTELYNPFTGRFTATANMTTPRGAFHTATLLPDGEVLITGGRWNTAPPYVQPADGASAELYEPSTGTFTATGNMTALHFGPAATVLPSGQVLIADGSDTLDGEAYGGAEIYDPITSTFRSTNRMPSGVYWPTATSLPSGKVLVAGGRNGLDLPISTAQLYDPSTGAFTPIANMTADRALHTATLLPDGTVLMTGGQSVGGAGVASA